MKAFVHTSSSSIVHDSESDPVWLDKTAPVIQLPQQKDTYAYTKGMAENIVFATIRKCEGLLTVAIWPVSIYGEGDRQCLPRVLKVFKDGNTSFQLGNNKNLSDLVYVGNVAQAHILPT